jgi:hypothetical protein
MLTIRPESGIRGKVNGVDFVGSTMYSLGQTLQFHDTEGNEFVVILTPGTTQDLAFTGSFPGGKRPAGGGFPDFDDIPFQSANGSGPGFTNPGRSDARMTTTSSYI